MATTPIQTSSPEILNSPSTANPNDIVTLQVGDRRFTTWTNTLTEESPVFASLLSVSDLPIRYSQKNSTLIPRATTGKMGRQTTRRLLFHRRRPRHLLTHPPLPPHQHPAPLLHPRHRPRLRPLHRPPPTSPILPDRPARGLARREAIPPGVENRARGVGGGGWRGGGS